MLAYELEYHVMAQIGNRINANDPNASMIKKSMEINATQPRYYKGDVREAFVKMLSPEKPRIYIE